MIPVQELSLPIRDSHLTCITFGSGPQPFVMIAGMSMAGLHGLGDGIAAAYSRFAEAYTVYVFDCCVDTPPAGWRVEDMAEDLFAAMEQLCLTDANVMGASLGGMIAQVLALRHPERVRCLALVSSICRPNETMERVMGHWVELADRKDSRQVYAAFLSDVYGPAFLEQNREALDALSHTGTTEQCVRCGILARACLGFRSLEWLDRLRCPAFVCGSRDDRIFTGDATVVLAEALNGELLLYEGFGHAVYDEAPNYQEHLLTFFRRVDARSSPAL